MRTAASFILASVLASAAGAAVNLRVHTPAQMPRTFGEWQLHDRELVWVEIRNYDPVTYTGIRLSGNIHYASGGKVVATTRDDDARMPRFTLPMRLAPNVPSVTVLRGRDCINVNTIIIDDQTKTQAVSTNSLPEGDFEFCLKLLKDDNTELTTDGTGGECSAFGVVLADPPALISPADQIALPPNTLPVFTWAQVAPLAPGTVVTYWLKVTPLFAGQSPRDAIDHNEVLFRMAMPVTSYQYLPSDRPFTAFPAAIGFAWQVESYDNGGKPITNNEGKSEVHTFHFEAPPVLVPPPPPLERDVSGGRGAR